MKIGQLFRSVAAKITAGPANLLRGVFPVSWGDPPERGTEDLLEGFDTMPWLRAAADKVGIGVANTDLELYAIRPGGGKAVRVRALQGGTWESRTKGLAKRARVDEASPVLDHVFFDALDDPNPFMARVGLLKITNVHLDLVGEAYWVKQRNALGTCVGFWPVPPHWVDQRPLPDRPTFEIQYRNWHVSLPERDVVEFLDPSPVHPYTRGSGIGWSLGDEVEVDEYAAKMAKALFFNQARPDFVVYGFSDPSEARRAERDWTNRLQGFWRSFKPYFLTGEPKFHEFTRPNMEQLVYPGLRKHQRDIVQQVWGIPPEMFGISEGKGLTRNHYESAEYIFTKWVVAPRCERLRGRLQRLVAEEYDDRIIVHYANPVPADRAFELSVMKAAAWAVSESEFRRLAGLPPTFPAGELRLIPLNSYVTNDPRDASQRPVSSGAPAAEPPREDDDNEKKTDATLSLTEGASGS